MREFRVAIVLLVLMLAIGGIWSHRAKMVEAIKVETCRTPCPPLAPEQLRLQVIKAYLHRQLAYNIEWHGAGGNRQLALLPLDVTEHDMARSITDSSLLALLTTNATILGSHAQIDALSVDSLAQDPSIAIYSLPHRDVGVIPTRRLRQASAAEVEGYFHAPGRTGGRPALSSWERWSGYGQHYFWITYWSANLACCDGRGEYQGMSRYRWTNNSLLAIQSVHPWLMGVSDRGELHLRDYDGEELLYY